MGAGSVIAIERMAFSRGVVALMTAPKDNAFSSAEASALRTSSPGVCAVGVSVWLSADGNEETGTVCVVTGVSTATTGGGTYAMVMGC